MVAIRLLGQTFCRLAKETSLQIKLSRSRVLKMSASMRQVNRDMSRQTQAVSDGELNVQQLSSAGGSSSSLSESCSRSGGPHGPEGPASRVVSWAVCFERLLEDHVGVRYFTEFLKSEVSAENILFYQACERFKKIPTTKLNELKKEARSIYDTFLSESSLHAVNIDDTAQTEETSLDTPTPDMFDKAQQQIFKLMKMDSYTRFVRSQLYQNCMLACVEGRPLPNIGTPEPKSKASKKTSTPPSNRKSVELKALSSDSKSNRKKRLEKRGSWGADGSYQQVTVSHKESQISVKSSSSLELVSGFGRTENVRCSVSISDPETLSSTAVKYCCVYLPDGTASLAPAKPGVTLRDMLSSLCEKRGFPLTDVFIYLHGKDKPLALDQDSSVFGDQQLNLQLKVTFVLEVLFSGRKLGIITKSSKNLVDVISAVLQKHQLRPQDVQVTMSSSDEPLSMSTNVYRLAGKTLCLDRVKVGLETRDGSPAPRVNSRTRQLQEMDGLVEMLSRAQCSRVEDQRGLLTKEQLELPKFLQLSAGNGTLTSCDASQDELCVL
ncbi:regulator of G-protein signaling 14a isoform X1 [Triplophysa rosa]|uniref:Regulator of G-protein signaling 14 n=1 Tax=Triplophysa rosa TaxID=992332 RepID=A0A9W7TT55_TRIRA|nr:regulator of G-protein signaling 14a isoform X1 [Triplophysa rosa]KAI7801489.1 regulator of G-protein signaling 14 [Triplophysa rosa]